MTKLGLLLAGVVPVCALLGLLALIARLNDLDDD
jgi:hypothetical protein